METIMAKKRNTFNVVCLIRKNRVMKNGQVPLFMRITVNSNVVDIPIAGSVNPSQWSQAQGKTRGNSREAQELNYNIQSVKSRIHQIFCDLGLAGKPITAQIIKDIYLGNHKDEEDGKTLVEVHSEHNERCRQLLNIEYAQSTIYKFDASLKYLKEFMDKELDRKDIPLKNINEDFIRKYELYLKTEKGCANNSAIKHLKIFKKIIRIALLNDWLHKDPFASIKFRQDEVHVEFLTMNELQTLINKEISIKRLSQIRDVFVFCSFTGLAFVDVKNLKEEHIIKNSDEEIWIRKPREKTNNMCNIPLLNIPKMLLEKYKDDRGCQLKGQLLPVPTNQKYNTYLKEIANLCGINKRLTAHVARHTFATEICLSQGVPIESVSRMLGHRDLRSTRIYAKITNHKIAEDMEALEERIKDKFQVVV